jgi:hypothetical protein
MRALSTTLLTSATDAFFQPNGRPAVRGSHRKRNSLKESVSSLVGTLEMNTNHHAGIEPVERSAASAGIREIQCLPTGETK